MSKLEDASNQMDAVREHLNETQILAEQVVATLDEARELAEASGFVSNVAQIDEVKSSIEELQTALIDTVETAEQIGASIDGMTTS